MSTWIILFIFTLLSLAVVGYLADKRAATGDKSVTPGLALLPGDIKYESQDGRVKVYFPIVTSIVASIILSLALRFFQQ